MVSYGTSSYGYDVRCAAEFKIFTNINEESLSFAAPAVAVNSFNRTQNFNDLYLTAFQASEKTHWPGNLKKYRIANGQIVDSNGVAAVDPTTGFFRQTAQSYWSINPDGNEVTAGGAANQLPNPSVRNVYTNITADNDLTAATNALEESNVNTFAYADLGLTGSVNEPTREQVINWARGVDVTDEGGGGGVWAGRGSSLRRVRPRPREGIAGPRRGLGIGG